MITVQKEIDLQREACLEVLRQLKLVDKLSPERLHKVCKPLPDYIINRAVWELVEKEQIEFTKNYEVKIRNLGRMVMHQS